MYLGWLIIGVSLQACTVDVIQVSEIEFFIAKEWKITTVYSDGQPQTEEDMLADDKLENYRLDIKDDFTFERTWFDGSKTAGTWQLTSGLSQLVLFAGEPHEERWLLIDLKLRRLEMRLLQEPTKPQLDIRYELEPVRGQ